MAGLGPAIHESIIEPMRRGWLYMMTNYPNGTLRLASPATSRAAPRNIAKGFTKHYGLNRLICMERYENIRDAIQREKTIKHYPRA